MKLKDQVCSLELAKKLKELGVKQESLWWWIKFDKEWQPQYRLSRYKDGGSYIPEMSTRQTPAVQGSYSAFTVAELGGMLPAEVGSFVQCHLTCIKLGGEFGVTYIGSSMGESVYFIDAPIKAKTEADARAKMSIYLKENKKNKEDK